MLPKLNNGVPSALVFMRPGDSRDERYVLRFWPSGYAVGDGARDRPLWLGALVHERLTRPAWPLNILRIDREARRFDARASAAAGLGATVLAQVDCHGTPVSLVVSPIQ